MSLMTHICVHIIRLFQPGPWIDKPMPSKVDLVSVRNSFISVVTFSTKNNDHYRQVIVRNSTIGNLTHLNPADSELRIRRYNKPIELCHSNI